MRGRVLLRPVLWARLVQQIRQAVRIRTWSSTALGRFTFTPLAFVLRIGISHKIQAIIHFTLTVVSMACRVVLLPLGMSALLSLPCLVIVRLGLLGTIRVGIFHQSSHESPHIIAVAFELSQLQLQRCKPAIAFQR